MAFDLNALSFISHIKHHFASLTKYRFNFSVEFSSFLCSFLHTAMSSTNCDNEMLLFGFGMSATLNMNKTGLRGLPCGTPCIGIIQVLYKFPILILILLSLIKSNIVNNRYLSLYYFFKKLSDSWSQ